MAHILLIYLMMILYSLYLFIKLHNTPAGLPELTPGLVPLAFSTRQSQSDPIILLIEPLNDLLRFLNGFTLHLQFVLGFLQVRLQFACFLMGEVRFVDQV